MFHFVKRHTTLQIKANRPLAGCLPLSGRLVESPGSAGGSKQSSKRLTLLRSSISSRRRYFTWFDSRGLGCPFTAKHQLDKLNIVVTSSVDIQSKMTKKIPTFTCLEHHHPLWSLKWQSLGWTHSRAYCPFNIISVQQKLQQQSKVHSECRHCLLISLKDAVVLESCPSRTNTAHTTLLQFMNNISAQAKGLELRAKLPTVAWK